MEPLGSPPAAGLETPQSADIRSLLHLPNAILIQILSHLTDALDLAAVAAACSALSSLVSDTRWERISSYTAQIWSPALAGSLTWAATRCPQLRALDLSGATALSDTDLLPLCQLSALTSLCLDGLWRVTGASTSRQPSRSQRRNGAPRTPGAPTPTTGSGSQELDVMAAILASNPGLLSLDVSNTAVPIGASLAAALAQLTAGAPNATKAAHGLQRLRVAGCGRGSGGHHDMLLGRVLLECPALVCLDAAGCRWLSSNALVDPEPGNALGAALTMLPLRRVSFAGCDLLGGIGWLVGCWEHLAWLDLSGTAVDDADGAAIADSCTQLQRLNLSGCCRIRGDSLAGLAGSLAVLSGRLCELRLADLAWVNTQHLAPLLAQLAQHAEAPLVLDLSGCGGLSDAAVQELVEGASRGRGPGVRELRLGGTSRLTTAALIRLAEATNAGSEAYPGGDASLDGEAGSNGNSVERDAVGCRGIDDGSAGRTSAAVRPLLRGLEQLELSHLQCLGSKASSASATAAAAAITALLLAAGPSLRRLSLDGCYAGGGVLSLLPRCCPGLQQISLVGCTGVGNDDLAALSALRSLSDVAVGGGASLAWLEHRALAGLRDLTRLRIARRPFLTDAQLAPLLAANRDTLAQLELAGCASLTDAALLHLLPAAGTTAALAAAPAATQAADAAGAPAEQSLEQQKCGSSKDGQQQFAAQQTHHDDGQEQASEQQGQESTRLHGSQQHDQRRQQPCPQAGRPPLLSALQLVCCDRITGASARHLGRLRSLRLAGCPAVTEPAVQAAAVSLTRLTLLELPNHLPLASLPVAPGGRLGHLGGLRVLGGLEERSPGRHGRRGSRI